MAASVGMARPAGALVRLEHAHAAEYLEDDGAEIPEVGGPVPGRFEEDLGRAEEHGLDALGEVRGGPAGGAPVAEGDVEG